MCPLIIIDSHINNSRIDSAGEFLDLPFKMLLTRLDIFAIKHAESLLFLKQIELNDWLGLGNTFGRV
jgi:hypothetical protein